MAHGFKTGGRQVGTPNKNRTALRERLATSYPDYDPLIALAEIALDQSNDLAVLRRHGLNPFVCGKTGRPLVTEVAVNQAMLRSVTNDFVPNMAAFD